MSYSIRTLDNIKRSKNIVLWGAGSYTKELIELIGIDKIVAVIDSSSQKQGLKIDEFIVQSPENVMLAFDKNSLIFVISVASFNYEIAVCLHKEWEIRPEHIYCFTHKFAEKYMYDYDAIQCNQKEIKEVIGLLNDDASKIYYKNLIESRLTRNAFLLKENDKIIDYYHYKNDNDEVKVKEGDTIIDCGAFVGDTAELFYRKTNGNCKIFCFEPFNGNYNKLVEWVSKNGYENTISCFHTFLGEKEGITTISSNNESSAQACESDCEKFFNSVSIKTLDSCIYEKVDFIKMDIEGSELKALEGAKKLIRENKPRMVISAYHRTAHLWEIPKLIKEIDPSYRLYLGHQPNVAFEPEYYAI